MTTESKIVYVLRPFISYHKRKDWFHESKDNHTVDFDFSPTVVTLLDGRVMSRERRYLIVVSTHNQLDREDLSVAVH